MGVTEELCRFAIEARFNDLSQETIKIAKERLLETIGVIAAASQETGEAAEKVIQVVREMGGTPTSTVIGGGFKTSSPNAAFANGTSALMLDLDETTTVPLCHQSAALVPAVLALGEQNGATGKQVIEAYVIGFEVGTRIGIGIGLTYFTRMGMHPVALWLTLGVTAACARLLNLDVEQTRWALGTAATGACGLRRSFGADSRPLHGGLSARNAIVAALLAKKGFTGHKDILDDDPASYPGDNMYFSFPKVFAGDGNYNLSVMTEGLGREFKMTKAGMLTRYHPGCLVSNAFAELTLSLMQKYGFTGAQVEKAECGATRAGLDIATYHAPQSSLEAHYSIEYFVAAALLDGKVGIAQFREERVHRPDIRQMMKKVHLYEHTDVAPSLPALEQFPVVKLAIRLTDGREFKGELKRTSGHPSATVPIEDLIAKYRDCTQSLLSNSEIERSIELLTNLERVKDIREPMNILMGKAR